MKMTKGELEAQISKSITQWEKDFLGRGSLSVKSDILRDMVIVSLQGILTPAEYRVCETNEGLLNIKRTRSELVESGEQDLKQIIVNITGIKVISLHSDLSTETGERIIVFKLEHNLEKLSHK
ncbi:DUF2294 domain-containing protein [Staphylococcus simiae]|uniref:DUF2294 domain-containing protein n=1 Tax=Staphylococcus simiae TaxID=308354 RepID=UPI001A979F11|nr:DUF2294 domain-containing protein [Staphylococcus simiae]MBO1199325.1 DUF2294 domain-containing protein [Staphylococcus simiae]MBO1201558.1 DUF2294 domain-containing protein [Staphylococcus simiae]MBO1203695.1 DUF2294 domain-containing protein [Staphylococcus simiae]MBO1211340.1 DUF2294 domain-containing protein [Staphylococcus simiae]MBO1229939.1 DUF2294 domain-containing protein [Staphylococcus simiae]